MNWLDERWVKSYSRITPELAAISWQAHGLYRILWDCAVDRGGALELGTLGTKGIAAVLRAPLSEIEAPLEELVSLGLVKLSERLLEIPGYRDAQASRTSDSARKRKQREIDKVTKRDEIVMEEEGESHPVTGTSQNGTKCHDKSQQVTSLSLSLFPSDDEASSKKKRGARKLCMWDAGVIEVLRYGQEVGLPWKDIPETSSTLAHIERRLRDGYTVEKCKAACLGVAKGECWQGEGKKTRGINHIFSKAENLDSAIMAGREVQERRRSATAAPKDKKCHRCGRPYHDGECAPMDAAPVEVQEKLRGLIGLAAPKKMV